jgi:hypothetical protein
MSPSRVNKEGPISSLKHWIMPLQVKGARLHNSATAAIKANDSPKKLRGKKGGKTPEPSPTCPATTETKPSIEKSEARTNLHRKQDEINKEDMDVEDGTERMELEEAEGGKKEEQRKPLPLEGLRFLASGLFSEIAEGPDPQWGPASNLYNGRNVLKRLVISQGGQFTLNINKQTKFLFVGLKPSEKTIEKACLVNADIISYTTLEGMIARTVAPEFTSFEPQPDLGEYSQGTNPPKILRDRTFPSVEPPPEAEETVAAKVSFTGV